VVRDDISRMGKCLEGLQLNENTRARQKILAWFSSLNFFPTQNDIYGKHHKGTGQWLLESQEFNDWLNGIKESLWCPGIREFQILSPG